jgi:hypothetical protein
MKKHKHKDYLGCLDKHNQKSVLQDVEKVPKEKLNLKRRK